MAQASPRAAAQPRVEVLPERSLTPSPSGPNIPKPQYFRDALDRLAGSNGQRRTSAALVIPDYAVRMALLDFQEFPAAEADRISLLRFRLRKSVPFHIEEARVSYAVQAQSSKRIDVLTVAIAQPILAEYEGLFSERGVRIGLVTPSSLAALPLFGQTNGLTLVMKKAGVTVSVLLVAAGQLRLVRSLDLSLGQEAGEELIPVEGNTDAVLALMQQTVAYAEDQIGEDVQQILLCGFDDDADFIGRITQQEFKVPATQVQSRFGRATQETSGLLGLLQEYAA